MIVALKIIGIALAIVVVLFCLDRVLLVMERRGWIYYRKRKPEGGATGSLFLEMQSFVEPSIKEVTEHRHVEALGKDDAIGDTLEPDRVCDRDDERDEPGSPETDGARHLSTSETDTPYRIG